MKKLMKFSSFLSLFLVALLLITDTVMAYSYTTVFRGVGPSLQFGPPIDGFPPITSKNNQPRSSGTNPHRGTDVRASVGTPVLAVCNGFVESQSSSSYELVLECDRDGDKIADDNLWVKHDHLETVGFVSTGSYVTKGTQIATSGDEGGKYAPHLHFGAMSYRDGVGRVWERNQPHYSGTSSWNYGNDTDFISYVRWNSSSTPVVRSYVMSDGNKISINSGDAVLFHRKDGTSTWSATTMTKSGDDFYYDLSNKYASGTVVNWMVRVTRSDLSSSYYRVGFMIPKYAQPEEDPNASSYKYDYYKCSIGGGCSAVETP
jgi:hypothetical protein